ncbi:MAG: twin-arginine translocase TatA/TatE family subunit [Armatimonadota bacterium]|nr:twin-arginine translocase TatA/TatE family subunit [Armatimonadota bacterium]MDR5689643.1 twin-arginine translocase TatA/TatE family subunit [Armatimonadota bacterium]MDR7392651.1 twin-arginine translocase TatA/TatE family subunit [Armatimonadota bacterium]MDR7394395.1 twin-arginine translocase TatA/TatE family subunit [Armatimonadota bacterium]MDR7397660.1 twin-arginine translocase TatA/TatE family subunit [Armatimonadota bacterium]
MFGPARLADLRSSLGKALRDFRKGLQQAEDHETMSGSR